MPPKTKIFVGKLPDNCSEASLQKLFDRHGEVTECSVLGNFAFVHMKTEDQALEAIRALNNFQFQGSTISVEQSTGERKGFKAGGGFRGGRGGGGRGGSYRPGGRGGGVRSTPYDRPPMGDRYRGPASMSDRYGGPTAMPDRYAGPSSISERYGRPSAISDRYGALPPSSLPVNGYYDEYERREPLRRPPLPPPPGGPLALERRPLPPPSLVRDPYGGRDPYDRYDSYDRLAGPPSAASGRRSPPLLERRPLPPLDYEASDHYAHLYRERDPYAGRDLYGARRVSPRRYGAPPRDLPPPPRRY